MRTLRDAVIAREEAWDKAMEREQNCRRQLARLTAEAITAHHLCETRQDELRVVTQALTVMTETEVHVNRKLSSRTLERNSVTKHRGITRFLFRSKIHRLTCDNITY